MLLNVLLLLGGCVLLYFGAEWLVRGASTIATALGISKAVIGLTLVAFGTSAPELFVNVIAGYNGETGFALSNVSGSNLTNICIGFGVCGFLTGIHVKWRAFRPDCYVLILSAAIILALLLLYQDSPRVPIWALWPLLLVLAGYLISLRRRAGASPEERGAERAAARVMWLSCGLFVAGVAALYGGGELVLTAAISIAETLDIDPPLIGLTIVAAGTSVPDTVASVIAARRGEAEIAVGNLLGSNISNVLVVLSSTIFASMAGGLPATDEAGTVLAAPGVLLASSKITLDYALVCVASLWFVALAAFAGRVNRRWGIAMIALYFGYMSYRVIGELISTPAVAG